MLHHLLLVAASVILSPESFVRGPDGVFTCDLAKAGATLDVSDGYHSGSWARAPRYPQVYFGSDPMTLAREPDAGWLTFEGEDGLCVGERPAGGYSLAGYWTHDWAFEALRVGSVSNGVPVFLDRHEWGIGKTSWGPKKRRYYAVNHRSFVTAEGEWHIAGTTLAFLPPGGDIRAKTVTVAWGGEPVLKLAHLRDTEIRGRHVAFGGGTGIDIRDCHNLLLADCTVECVEGNAIEIASDCTDVVVSNCVIRNVGCRGVVLNGGDRRTLAKGRNRVVDCDIVRFGLVQRVYAPGIALNGCGNEIVRCRIHEAPHSAIIYGGNEHLIADNDIFDVIRETGDAGAIYTGRDWTSQGNRLVRNRIHDLGRTVSNGISHDVFTMGVYLDDCDCGDTIESNVFVRAGCAVMMGGGRDNVVRGNRMVDCDIGIHLDDRGVTWTHHWNNPNDASWNLVAKAEALHYREDPWKSRYPHLAKTMDDEPRLPKYNVFDGNELVRCRIPYQFDTRAAVRAHAAMFWSEETKLFRGRDGDSLEAPFLNGLALSAAVIRRDGARAEKFARGLLARGSDAASDPTVRLAFARYAASGLASEDVKKAMSSVLDAGAEPSDAVLGDAKKAVEASDGWTAGALLGLMARLEMIRLRDTAHAAQAEAAMKACARLAAARFVAGGGADGEHRSDAAALACAVAMASKVAKLDSILGDGLCEKWAKLRDDCLYGLNGQPALWETHPARFLAFLNVTD